MSDLANVPSYGALRKREPRVLEAKFGDGYIQRVSDGINNDLAVWDVTFENLTSSAADTLDNFFATKGGVTAFTWTPPVGAEIKCVCKSWERSFYDKNSQSITCTIEEVAL